MSDSLFANHYDGPHARRGGIRYGQCDDTCTADCGHCKGQGPPQTFTEQPPHLISRVPVGRPIPPGMQEVTAEVTELRRRTVRVLMPIDGPGWDDDAREYVRSAPSPGGWGPAQTTVSVVRVLYGSSTSPTASCSCPTEWLWSQESRERRSQHHTFRCLMHEDVARG